ncbi:ABC transporter substrate-binding protein [Limnohabitans sp. T6-5]|uniref:ABC transporter substrate-binding protein n=1 Tax=Limnohabitans sp. T6-5 TaxID=1100724 RepID=UPI0018EE70BA
MLHLPRRHLLTLLLAALPMVSFAAPPKGGAANLAMIGEPQSLDPMASTADLVGTIMQHVYETLYTFDSKWNVTPMLADGMPKVSVDGLTYAVNIRKGVKLHSGRDLDAQDVVASLKRWMEMAPRGKSVAKDTVSLEAKGSHAIEWKFNAPNASLLAQLALPSGMAAIMAKESIAAPLSSFVGTGPYKFKERRPDQFVILSRFDTYSARKEAPNGYGGKREALLDELRFTPVPNANTRVEGALAGQFHFADQLPTEALARVEKAGPSVVPILTPSFGFPYMVFNTKEGVMANQGIRQAIQIAIGEGEMMAAAYGDKRFFIAEGNHFPQGTPFYSTAGTDQYNKQDAKRAKEMADKAGYKGETIRLLTSRQYEFHHTMVQVMAEQLRAAGFKPEMQVVDWATLVQRRGDSKVWDIYMTHSGQFPEPILSPPQLGECAPGWWSSAAKAKALGDFNQQPDPSKRAQLWGAVQQVVYNEVPYINIGKFSSLSSRSNKLEGYIPATWPFFWNTGLSK